MSSAAETVHVVVLTLKEEAFVQERFDDHTWIYPTNSSSRFRLLIDAVKLIYSQVYWHWEFQVSLIVSDDPFLSGWIGMLLARWYNRPWIVHVSKDYWNIRGVKDIFGEKFWLLTVAYILDHAYAVLIFSNDAERLFLEAAKAGSRARLVSFATFIDIDAVRSAPVTTDIHSIYPNYKFVLLLVSPIERGKHLDLALDVLKLLRERYRQAGLVIVGRGAFKSSIEAKATAMGLEGWVSFEEGDENLDSYFKTTNMLVNFSSLETSEEKSVLVKAAAAGCLIVASDNEFVRDIIRDNENGIIVQGLEAGSYVVRIIKLNETTGLRETFKVNSDAYIQSKFVEKPEEFALKFKEVWAESGEAEKNREKNSPHAYLGMTLNFLKRAADYSVFAVRIAYENTGIWLAKFLTKKKKKKK